MGWNLPPGCNESDLPGNRPEDEEWDYFIETFEDELDGLSDEEVERKFQEWRDDWESWRQSDYEEDY